MGRKFFSIGAPVQGEYNPPPTAIAILAAGSEHAVSSLHRACRLCPATSSQPAPLSLLLCSTGTFSLFRLKVGCQNTKWVSQQVLRNSDPSTLVLRGRETVLLVTGISSQLACRDRAKSHAPTR